MKDQACLVLASTLGLQPSLVEGLETGESFKNQIVSLECLDGSTKKVFESTSPLRALDGAIVGAVVVMQDLTEQGKLEADFEERVARLVSIGVELEGAAVRGDGTS